MTIEVWLYSLTVVCIIELIWSIVIASKIDRLERERKKYNDFLKDTYDKYMKEDYEAKHRYKDAAKYAPGGPEDRI